jgi:hypothetical protein
MTDQDETRYNTANELEVTADDPGPALNQKDSEDEQEAHRPQRMKMHLRSISISSNPETGPQSEPYNTSLLLSKEIDTDLDGDHVDRIATRAMKKSMSTFSRRKSDVCSPTAPQFQWFSSRSVLVKSPPALRRMSTDRSPNRRSTLRDDADKGFRVTWVGTVYEGITSTRRRSAALIEGNESKGRDSRRKSLPPLQAWALPEIVSLSLSLSCCR